MVLCQKHFQNKKDTRGAVFFGTGARGRGAPWLRHWAYVEIVDQAIGPYRTQSHSPLNHASFEHTSIKRWYIGLRVFFPLDILNFKPYVFTL